MTGEHEPSGIVPVGKRVDQVLGAEYVAELAAERRAARAQRQAEGPDDTWRRGAPLSELHEATSRVSPHDIDMFATERQIGTEVLRGLLDGGQDLSRLHIEQGADGHWQVEPISTDPVDAGNPTASGPV